MSIAEVRCRRTYLRHSQLCLVWIYKKIVFSSLPYLWVRCQILLNLPSALLHLLWIMCDPGCDVLFTALCTLSICIFSQDPMSEAIYFHILCILSIFLSFGALLCYWCEPRKSYCCWLAGWLGIHQSHVSYGLCVSS